MGTQGASQHSYTFDADSLLHDGVAITATGAGTVASVAKVIDFGAAQAGTGVVNIAYTKFDLVIDVRAMDFTTGDETYQLILQLSDDADADGGGFDAGDTIRNKLVVPLGDNNGVAGSTADDANVTGRLVVGGDNEFFGTVFRFARLFVVVGGTTPSITPFVWLGEEK